MVTISVIVCTYNQEATIARALDAILAQQCTVPYEVIIGEDASTDNTRKICQEYAKKYPDIIRIMPEAPNKGIVDNYYGCVREAKGEYIMECAGDDEWCAGRMQLCIDTIKSNDGVVQVFSQVYYRNDHTGEITEPDNFLFPTGMIKGKDVIEGMMHQRSDQNVFFAITRRRAIINLLNQYPEFFSGRKYRAEDKQLIVLLGTKGDFINLSNRTYYYTIDNSSITRGSIAKHIHYNINMLRLNHDLAKAVNYRGSMLPTYLHIIYITCRLVLWKSLIKMFPFLHHFHH